MFAQHPQEYCDRVAEFFDRVFTQNRARMPRL
jgi:hypothetical protein